MANKDIDQTKIRMEKAITNLEEEFNTIRVGRANPHVLDKIMVDYYGTPSPINQVANISVPEPRMITIQPWERNMIGDIERAIMKSDLGLNPVNDGTMIRLSIPQLTKERRQEIVKVVHKKTEEGRVGIRNIRRDAIDALKKLEKTKEISEDELKKAQDDMQKLTDKYIKEADKVMAAKEKEVMEV